MYHNHLPLVFLSVLLACIGSYVALTFIVQLGSVTPRLRRLWRGLTVMTTAATIWSMHFIGILACNFPVPITFDPWLTLLSLLAAQAATYLMLQTLREGKFSYSSPVFFAGGVVAMHYIGMAAMRGPMVMTYSPDWIAASGAAAIGMSSFALQVARTNSAAESGRWQRGLGAVLLGLSISAMHYVGMQGVMMMPLPGKLPAVQGQQPLALALAGGVLFICAGLMIAIQIDRQLALRSQRNEELLALSLLEEERYWTVINALTEGVLIIDSVGKLVACNDSARQVFDLPPDSSVPAIQQIGESQFFGTDAQHVPLHQLPGNRAIAQGLPIMNVQLQLRTPKGQKWVSMNAAPLPVATGDRPGAVVSIKDITREWEYEQKLLYQAMHDELTLLPNRRQFNTALTAAIEDARKQGTQVGVLYFDLDHFKAVNDTLGHHIGDQLLQEVTAQLGRVLPLGAVPARFGGDEFCVLLPHISQEQDVWEVVKQIQGALEAPMLIQGRQLHVGVSLGFSLYPEDGEDTITLLQHADLALNVVKLEGRGGSQRFSPQQAQRRKREVEIERAMRETLGTERFELHYQPLYDLAEQRPVSCEALMRWTHPELGFVSPAEFIPIAEESDIINALGEWALRSACQQARAWCDAGTPLVVAVNISMRQFRSGQLPDLIRQLLAEAELEARWLSLEVTETALMSSQDAAVRQLSEIRALGVQVALDDFGTGYSSLHVLQGLPIDKLKLDRSFVEGITSSSRQHAMLRGIVGLAHDLGLTVVAEGIETEQQYRELLGMQCQVGQGYLFSRPVQASVLTEMLRQGARWSPN